MKNQEKQIDLGPLDSLPTESATEYTDWLNPRNVEQDQSQADPVEETKPCRFDDEREYRLCKQVIDNPLKPSSQYPKLIGISSKTAVSIRRKLVEKQYIRERKVDSSSRGRSSILLEALSAGVDAVAQYESQAQGDK